MDIITSISANIISIVYVVLICHTASIMQTCRDELMAASAIVLMVIHNLRQQQNNQRRVGHARLTRREVVATPGVLMAISLKSSSDMALVRQSLSIGTV